MKKNYHIFIFSKSWIGSGMANIGQTLNMAQHFSNHFETSIFLRGVIKNNKLIAERILGQSPRFNIEINNKNIVFHLISCFKKIFSKPKTNVIFFSRNVPACMALSLFGYHSILELHQDNFNRYKIIDYLLGKLFKINLFKNKIKIVVISESLKKIICLKFKLKNDIYVSHDASNLPNDDLLKLRKRNRKLIVYTGKLGDDRSVNHILDIAKHDTNSDFRIIGGTLEQVKKYRNHAKSQKLNNIKIFKRQRFSRIQFLQCKADVLLAFWSNNVPTMKYCSPLKLFEYMQTGNRILLHDFPVFKEVVPKNELIELCVPDNLDSEINAYTKIISKNISNTERDKLLKHGSIFTYESRVKNILNFYFNEA